MGNRYSHFTIEERCEIARLQAEGRSTGSRCKCGSLAIDDLSGVEGNGNPSSGYKPAADEQSRARRWPAHVWIEITACATKCSLVSEQAGRSRLLDVSSWKPAGQSFHTRAHRFIYAQLAVRRTTPETLPASAKSKRGWRGRRGGSPASFIAQRRPLVERPQEADDRRLLAIGRLT